MRVAAERLRRQCCGTVELPLRKGYPPFGKRRGFFGDDGAGSRTWDGPLGSGAAVRHDDERDDQSERTDERVSHEHAGPFTLILQRPAWSCRCILPCVTALVRWTVLLALLALRIPSLVQPAGADQSLYTYVGLRILDGGTPYLDAWDQKPPGVHLLYALLWRIWPDERVVAASDLAAAIAVCWLLILIGRRVASNAAGWTAAYLSDNSRPRAGTCADRRSQSLQ